MILTLDRCIHGMVLTLEICWYSLISRPRETSRMVWFQIPREMLVRFDFCPRETHFPKNMPYVSRGGTTALEAYQRLSRAEIPRETLKMVWFQIPREMLVQFDLCPRETYFPTKMPNVSRGGTTALEAYQRLSRAEIPRETLKTMTWLYKVYLFRIF